MLVGLRQDLVPYKALWVIGQTWAMWRCQLIPIPVLDTTAQEPSIGSIDTW